MCWVGNDHKARQLAARSKDGETKIISDMFQTYDEGDNNFLDEEKNIKPIFEKYSCK